MPSVDLRFPGEVRLALADLARLLADVAPGDGRGRQSQAPEDDDRDFAAEWLAGLRKRTKEDLGDALRLLKNPDFGEGPVVLDDNEALGALRGFTALRLTLRATALKALPDEALESGRVDRRKLAAPGRRAYACYGALGEIQAMLCEALS